MKKRKRAKLRRKRERIQAFARAKQDWRTIVEVMEPEPLERLHSYTDMFLKKLYGEPKTKI